MKRLRVLYLTSRELSVHRLHDGALTESFAFAASAEGVAGFRRYLEGTRDEPALLLADLVEEEFRTEAIPHAGLRDGKELRERHARRLFPSTTYRAAIPLGREAGGRRDDRILLSALTHPEALAPWLTCLRESRVPLLAISSAAHVSATLLPRLGLHGAHLLLVTQSDEGDFRQTFFLQGELRFSRLIRRVDAARQDGAVLRDEIARTRDYLHRLGLLADDQPLEAVIIAARPIGAEANVMAPGIEVQWMEPDEAGRRLAVALPHAEALLVQQFARERRNVYPQPWQMQSRREYTLRQIARQAGVAGTVALLALTVHNGVEAIVHHAAARAATQLSDRYERLLVQTPADASSPDPRQMKEAVEMVEQLATRNEWPMTDLARIGQVLHGFPEFEVRRLRWESSVGDAAGRLADGGPEGQPAVAGSAGVHTVVVEGEMVGRAVSGRIRDLVIALRKDPSVIDVELPGSGAGDNAPDAGRSAPPEGSATPIAVRVVVHS